MQLPLGILIKQRFYRFPTYTQALYQRHSNTRAPHLQWQQQQQQQQQQQHAASQSRGCTSDPRPTSVALNPEGPPSSPVPLTAIRPCRPYGLLEKLFVPSLVTILCSGISLTVFYWWVGMHRRRQGLDD